MFYFLVKCRIKVALVYLPKIKKKRKKNNECLDTRLYIVCDKYRKQCIGRNETETRKVI